MPDVPPIASTGGPEIGKVEPYQGWLMDMDTHDLTPSTGIIIRWRFEGERRWRKKNIIADPEQGQTVESLREQVPEIVAVLVGQETGESVSLPLPSFRGRR